MFDFLKRQLFGQPEPETTITLPDPVDPPPEFSAAVAKAKAAAAKVQRDNEDLLSYRPAVWGRVEQAIHYGQTTCLFSFKAVAMSRREYLPYVSLARAEEIANTLVADYQAKGYRCWVEQEYDVKGGEHYICLRITWGEESVPA